MARLQACLRALQRAAPSSHCSAGRYRPRQGGVHGAQWCVFTAVFAPISAFPSPSSAQVCLLMCCNMRTVDCVGGMTLICSGWCTAGELYDADNAYMHPLVSLGSLPVEMQRATSLAASSHGRPAVAMHVCMFGTWPACPQAPYTLLSVLLGALCQTVNDSQSKAAESPLGAQVSELEVVYVCWDVLYAGDTSVTARPLTERQAVLRSIVKDAPEIGVPIGEHALHSGFGKGFERRAAAELQDVRV